MSPRAAIAAAAGLLTVAAATTGFLQYGLPAAIFAALLALLGLRVRAAAALAVLSVIGILTLGHTSTIPTMLTGLAATAYLLTAYPLRLPAGVMAAVPTVIVSALVFAAAALLAAALPVPQPSWLPLVAPVTVVLIYQAALWPFVRRQANAQRPRRPNST